MPRGGRARPRRARARLLAFVLCCALPVAGCTHRSGRSGEPGSASAAPRRGGTLRIALVTPGSLDPAQATGPEQRLLVGNLFDSLTTLDAAGAVRPAAAASWSSDQTMRHWRFQLRPGATYADGRPVQAADFKAAWERLASPRTRPRPASPAALLGLVEGYQAVATGGSRTISGITAPDPTTLVIDLSQPFADFPTLVADPRLSPIPPRAPAGGTASLAARSLGNGPFMLARSSSAQTLQLVRNPHYAGRAAYLDRVQVQVVPDQQTAWLAFQHGQVSFAAGQASCRGPSSAPGRSASTSTAPRAATPAGGAPCRWLSTAPASPPPSRAPPPPPPASSPAESPAPAGAPARSACTIPARPPPCSISLAAAPASPSSWPSRRPPSTGRSPPWSRHSSPRSPSPSRSRRSPPPACSAMTPGRTPSSTGSAGPPTPRAWTRSSPATPSPPRMTAPSGSSPRPGPPPTRPPARGCTSRPSRPCSTGPTSPPCSNTGTAPSSPPGSTASISPRGAPSTSLPAASQTSPSTPSGLCYNPAAPSDGAHVGVAE